METFYPKMKNTWKVLFAVFSLSLPSIESWYHHEQLLFFTLVLLKETKGGSSMSFSLKLNKIERHTIVCCYKLWK